MVLGINGPGKKVEDLGFFDESTYVLLLSFFWLASSLVSEKLSFGGRNLRGPVKAVCRKNIPVMCCLTFDSLDALNSLVFENSSGFDAVL